MAVGFKLRKHLLGATNPAHTEVIIANSQTVSLGDAVKMSTGYAAVCDANDRIFGFVSGIVTENGIDLKSASTDDYDGTYSGEQGQYGSETYVAAADNVTDKKVKVRVIADPYALVYNDADGDMELADVGQFFSLVDEDQVDADTNSATVGELQLWQWDPDGDGDASKGLFKLASWQGDSFEPEA